MTAALPIDYSTLDPGIREVVRLLREHGFDTCDSGDGKSKPDIGGPDSCALSEANVTIRVRPVDLAAETDRVCAVLRAEGVLLGHDPASIAEYVDVTLLSPTDGVVVEGSYLPCDVAGEGVAIVTVLGLDDELLATCRARRP